jgi:site-specific DNA-methyltransferase (adenine-specific)
MNAEKRKPVMYGDQRRWALVEADSLALLPQLPDASVDAVVTDPPYGLGFGKEAWDGKDIARRFSSRGEAQRASVAFERFTAVWAAECRRVLRPGGHLVAFGSPRMVHRLTVGIEDAGLEIRDQVMWLHSQGVPKGRLHPGGLSSTLKPAFEPIVIARRPFSGTLAVNLAEHGTGALNIESTRIAGPTTLPGTSGYWPANVAYSHDSACTEAGCVDGCPCPLIDRQTGKQSSRVFFCAKATRAEREAGCEDLPVVRTEIFSKGGPVARRNIHPTVKPIALKRWLVRLACPPGGVVLDPFAGSASGGAAAMLEGRRFLGLERDPRYIAIGRARLTHWAARAAQQGDLSKQDRQTPGPLPTTKGGPRKRSHKP